VSNGLAFVANANDGLRIYRAWNATTTREFPVSTIVMIVSGFVLVVIAGIVWQYKSRSRIRALTNTPKSAPPTDSPH